MFHGLILWRSYEMLLTFWRPGLVGMWGEGEGTVRIRLCIFKIVS